MTAMPAVEFGSVIFDPHRKAAVSFFSPQMTAFRTDRPLLAGSVPDADTKFLKFINHHASPLRRSSASSGGACALARMAAMYSLASPLVDAVSTIALASATLPPLAVRSFLPNP